MVRRERHPKLPSRLKALFVCPNILSAKSFSKFRDNPNDTIWKIEIIDQMVPSYITDWTRINTTNRTGNEFEQDAIEYWTLKVVEESKQEMLVFGDIRIIEEVRLIN